MQFYVKRDYQCIEIKTCSASIPRVLYAIEGQRNLSGGIGSDLSF